MRDPTDEERDCPVALTAINEKIKQHEQHPTNDSPEALAILRLIRDRKLDELNVIRKALYGTRS
jgi:hypothetical protein